MLKVSQLPRTLPGASFNILPLHSSSFFHSNLLCTPSAPPTAKLHPPALQLVFLATVCYPLFVLFLLQRSVYHFNLPLLFYLFSLPFGLLEIFPLLISSFESFFVLLLLFLYNLFFIRCFFFFFFFFFFCKTVSFYRAESLRAPRGGGGWRGRGAGTGSTSGSEKTGGARPTIRPRYIYSVYRKPGLASLLLRVRLERTILGNDERKFSLRLTSDPSEPPPPPSFLLPPPPPISPPPFSRETEAFVCTGKTESPHLTTGSPRLRTRSFSLSRIRQSSLSHALVNSSSIPVPGLLGGP